MADLAVIEHASEVRDTIERLERLDTVSSEYLLAMLLIEMQDG